MLKINIKTQTYLKNLIDKEHDGILIKLNKKGCSGYSFDFSLANDGNYYLDFIDFKIYIDNSALKYVFGAELFLFEDILSKKLQIITPYEQSKCGCGESINLKEEL